MNDLSSRHLPLALAALALLAFAPPGTHRRRVTVDGRSRAYLVRVPPADGRVLRPAVIVLHGHGGTASKAMRISRMNAAADAHGFLAVYPEGASWAGTPWRSWNAGSCCGYAEAKGVDDLAFLRALIADLQQVFPVDPARLYVTGMSNGGMMAYRAACELSDLIAAIAPVAGAMAVAPCEPQRPVSVLIIHGTKDRYVPYDGGISAATRDDREDPPVMETAAFWAKRNGCAAVPERTPRGRVTHARFPNCADGTAVEAYTVEGGKHAWPGGRRGRLFGDRPARGFSATEAMWEFFEQHPSKGVTSDR